jgi:hypothetical protein
MIYTKFGNVPEKVAETVRLAADVGLVECTICPPVPVYV